MIQAKNLTKSFNGHAAVNQLNLDIDMGQIFCLLGANGAGKTTTINLFLNFISPSSGEALICGLNTVEKPKESKAFLAYIPENLNLYPNLSGMENLDYFSGLAGQEYEKGELEMFLKEAGLQAEAFEQRVKTYSKGMRQKVGLAIAMAKKAKVLLLDEPTSGLDPHASHEFADLLQKLRAEGVAVLMATHDLFRAKETGTQIGIMREGNLVASVEADAISHSELEKLYLKHVN